VGCLCVHRLLLPVVYGWFTHLPRAVRCCWITFTVVVCTGYLRVGLPFARFAATHVVCVYGCLATFTRCCLFAFTVYVEHARLRYGLYAWFAVYGSTALVCSRCWFVLFCRCCPVVDLLMPLPFGSRLRLYPGLPATHVYVPFVVVVCTLYLFGRLPFTLTVAFVATFALLPIVHTLRFPRCALIWLLFPFDCEHYVGLYRLLPLPRLPTGRRCFQLVYTHLVCSGLALYPWDILHLYTFGSHGCTPHITLLFPVLPVWFLRFPI